jgi:hypothetical protein
MAPAEITASVSEQEGQCCGQVTDAHKPSTSAAAATEKQLSESCAVVECDAEADSCCSSSIQDDDSSPVHQPSCSIETEDEEDLEAVFDTKDIYTSQLPEPQPLYQIYMLQEQEKMLEEDPSGLLKPAALVAIQAASGSPRVPSVANIIDEDHEADSVCDSNEADDLASVSIRRQSSSASTDSGRGADTVSQLTSNTSMRRERLTAGSMCGSQRSLWCELAEVKSAGLLESLDNKSKKLMEAYFEVITSEASYLRSLNVLVMSFMTAPELMGSKDPNSLITNQERKQLFSNVVAIRDCSERLLCDLENRLKASLVLSDVCDILCEHFEKHFDAYVKYCSNQVYQDRTLKKLKATNSQFVACIQRIESNRQCQGLDFRSFMMLPMQRITRYRLLVNAICDRVVLNTQQHATASRAVYLADQVANNCNEGARRMERTEQLLEIERRLIYKSADLKRIALVSSSRHVVKSGPLTQLLERRSKAKLNVLQSKIRTRSIHLFLFSDLLLIAKKKSNGSFICKDYADRRMVSVEPLEPHSRKLPDGAVSALPTPPQLFLFLLMRIAL